MIQRIFAFFVFCLLFIKEFILSNLNVAGIVLFTPRKAIDSRLVSYQCTELTKRELLLIAHLITLTPGTLVIEIEEEKRRLIIHVLCRKKEGESSSAIERDLYDWINGHLKEPLLRATR